MTPLLLAVFMASLVGSLHCAGMCGGIVTLCVGGRPVSRVHRWTPHALYHFGRLVTYASLGAASGTVGAAIDLGGAAVGWTRAAMVLAGGTMLSVGAIALLRGLGLRMGGIALPAPLRHAFQRALALSRTLPAGIQPFMIGLLTGVLPCGWLYAFVISAAGTGRPGLGALTMIVFWAGTVPILVGVGIGAQAITVALRPHIPRLTAVALMVVGLVTITGRIQLPAYADGAMTTIEPGAATVERIRALGNAPPPCCQEAPAESANDRAPADP